MSILTKRVLLISLALLILAFTVVASANALNDIRKRGSISIGIHASHVPFGFIDSQGKNAGLEIDISHYVALKLLGSSSAIRFVPVTPTNRIPYIKRGNVDAVIATFSNTAKRRKVIDFTNNYYASGATLLAAKNSGIHAWKDVKGKKVCGVQGSYYNTHFSKMGLDMVNFPDTVEAYKALKGHRCIGIAFDSAQIVGKLKQSWWHKHYHMATSTIMIVPMGMGVRKGNDALRQALNKIILQMEASGYIYALQTKWGIPHTRFVIKHMLEARKKLGMSRKITASK
jgi:polar amino acid transport system substrate-binding protein